MNDRAQKPGPEKIDLFHPEDLVKTIVKGIAKKYPKAAEQLASLNVCLDEFYQQLIQMRRAHGEGPGTVFVEKTMGLLQKEIEGRDLKLPLGGTT